MPLESTIQRLAKTASPSAKSRMRRQILRRIEGSLLTDTAKSAVPDRVKLKKHILARVAMPKAAGVLEGIRTALSPSLATVLDLRAEVLDRIALWQPIPVPLWQRTWKPVAVTAALALVLRMTPALFIASPIQASSQNLLNPTQGVVATTDGAEWNELSGELVLDHPMTIRTGVDSAATIVIGSDAVLRLGENTEVNLREAAFDPSNSGPIARVSYGQLWMMSSLPEALLAGTSIVLPQGTLGIKQGSVSILADPQQSAIQVFHGFARVMPTGDDAIHLIQGDQLVMLPGGGTQRHLITDAMRSNEWVTENLSRDAVHRSEVTKRKQELAETAAGILPDSAFYLLKLASEKFDLGLTLSGKSRQEKKLMHAQTRLNEAVALLNTGKADEATRPLEAYREAIRSIATLSEEEVRALLADSLLSSSSTVADALPNSELYAVKEAVLEAAAEVQATEIQPNEVDLYLLSDALLEIESLIAQGEIFQATSAFNGIEGAVASVTKDQTLGETVIGKDALKAMKTILRSIAFSLTQAEEIVQGDEGALIASLKERVAGLSPSPAPATVATTDDNPNICMTVREVLRRTNQFLASVYTYQTPRAQRNEVLRQISLLPDCPQSGRVLAKVMNKVPVFTRSFVWEALHDIGSDT